MKVIIYIYTIFESGIKIKFYSIKCLFLLTMGLITLIIKLFINHTNLEFTPTSWWAVSPLRQGLCYGTLKSSFPQ